MPQTCSTMCVKYLYEYTGGLAKIGAFEYK